MNKRIESLIGLIGQVIILWSVLMLGILFSLNPNYYPYINKQYIDDYYTCRHFSEDFALMLNDTHNVSIITGYNEHNEHHAWVEVDGVQYEVTGETRKILWFEEYKEEKRYNITEWITRNDYWDNKRDMEIEMSR